MVLVVLVALGRLPESAQVATLSASGGASEASLSAGPGWRAGVSGLEAIPVTEASLGPSDLALSPSDLAVTDPVSSASVPDTTVAPHTHPPDTTAPPHTHPPETTVPHTHPPDTTAPPHTHPPETTVPPTAPPAVLAAPEVVGSPPTTQVQEGVASWFGAPERTCAHLTIPKGTEVKVTLLTPAGPGPSVTCVIADYGPTDTSRIIDLSDDTFKVLAPLSVGLINVRIEW